MWINARPDDVWRTYVDPSRLPEWQTGSPVIADIRGSGDQPGSTYTSSRGPGTARTEVISADRPRRIVTSTVAYFGLKFDVDTRLLSEAGGTQMQLLAKHTGPVGWASLAS